MKRVLKHADYLGLLYFTIYLSITILYRRVFILIQFKILVFLFCLFVHFFFFFLFIELLTSFFVLFFIFISPKGLNIYCWLIKILFSFSVCPMQNNFFQICQQNFFFLKFFNCHVLF